MSLLTLSRWQFAVTVMFHMTFPAITVGLSILLPVPFAFISRWLPSGATVTALRDAIYFSRQL